MVRGAWCVTAAALIAAGACKKSGAGGQGGFGGGGPMAMPVEVAVARTDTVRDEIAATGQRSEEHTSELQSPCNLVCRLLLEKKKKKIETPPILTLATQYCALTSRS